MYQLKHQYLGSRCILDLNYCAIPTVLNSAVYLSGTGVNLYHPFVPKLSGSDFKVDSTSRGAVEMVFKLLSETGTSEGHSSNLVCQKKKSFSREFFFTVSSLYTVSPLLSGGRTDEKSGFSDVFKRFSSEFWSNNIIINSFCQFIMFCGHMFNLRHCYEQLFR